MIIYLDLQSYVLAKIMCYIYKATKKLRRSRRHRCGVVELTRFWLVVKLFSVGITCIVKKKDYIKEMF